MKLPSLDCARPIQQMRTSSYLRISMLTALIALTMAPVVHAQSPAPGQIDPRYMAPRAPRADRFSALPVTQPTELPPAQPASPTPAANTLPAPIAATPLANEAVSTRAKRAQVTFVDRQLNVRANDSSLNQILRAISRETGLKITGGVQDQRVFGNYGPASTSSVLSTLLDGTGTNLLLLEGDATTPPELILTPRGGGATPPNPNAPGFDDGIEPEPPPQPQQVVQTAPQTPTQQQMPQQQTPGTNPSISVPPVMPQPLNNVNGSPLNTSPTASTLPTTDSVPTDQLPVPSTTPSTSGIVDSPNPPAPGSTTGTNPTNAPTPEQVYQQLLKMQQQNQQPTQVAQPVPANPPQ